MRTNECLDASEGIIGTLKYCIRKIANRIRIGDYSPLRLMSKAVVTTLPCVLKDGLLLYYRNATNTSLSLSHASLLPALMDDECLIRTISVGGGA